MVHASPSPLAGAPPLAELAPPLAVAPPLPEVAPPLPEVAPPLPLGTHTGQFVDAHSPTASVAVSHAFETCEPPAEPVSQLEQKLVYCELHLLSTQLTHAAEISVRACAAAQAVELLSELLQASPLRPAMRARQSGISFFIGCVLVRGQ
jgi:hypothetical protein